MTDFYLAYQKTIESEGLWSFRTSDRGGETWKGISRVKNPDWSGWRLVDKIRESAGDHFMSALQNSEKLEEKVRDFYLIEFWNRLQCYDLVHQQIAEELFDTAVNQGVFWAARYFQIALSMLNNNTRYYPDLRADGSIGPLTLEAYRRYLLTADTVPGRTLQKNISVLLKVLNGLQFQRYREICEKDLTQEVNFYGWINQRIN